MAIRKPITRNDAMYDQRERDAKEQPIPDPRRISTFVIVFGSGGSNGLARVAQMFDDGRTERRDPDHTDGCRYRVRPDR